MKVELREELGSLVVAVLGRAVEAGVERQVELCMRIQDRNFDSLRSALESMGAKTIGDVVSIV